MREHWRLLLQPETMSGSVQADLSSDLLTEGCGEQGPGFSTLKQLIPVGGTLKKIRSLLLLAPFK